LLREQPAASQAAAKEAEKAKQESKRKAKVRPAFAHGLLCKRDYV
jgi:hypothetical protein